MGYAARSGCVDIHTDLYKIKHQVFSWRGSCQIIMYFKNNIQNKYFQVLSPYDIKL